MLSGGTAKPRCAMVNLLQHLVVELREPAVRPYSS